MKIVDRIKNPFVMKKERFLAKRKQKKLIKMDDKSVVEYLPADEDNSAIDIHKIVENMDDPENMAEVVENNLEEIICQNQVRNTMKYLDDSDVLRILNENNKKLLESEKIMFAIEAIGSNDKKIKAIIKNLEGLNDCELGKILETLKPETQPWRRAEMEEQKIRIVSKRILRHMINNGGAWHLKELTETLEEKSKLSVAKRCLETIVQYEKERDYKKHITSTAKSKLVMDLFELIDMPYDTKIATFNEFLNQCLTPDEIQKVQHVMEEERIKKEKSEMEKAQRICQQRVKQQTVGMER